MLLRRHSGIPHPAQRPLLWRASPRLLFLAFDLVDEMDSLIERRFRIGLGTSVSPPSIAQQLPRHQTHTLAQKLTSACHEPPCFSGIVPARPALVVRFPTQFPMNL
jgi:hypothetical protein